MTTIIAYKDEDQIWLGSDRAYTRGNLCLIGAFKWFKTGSYAVAVAGSHRLRNLLEREPIDAPPSVLAEVVLGRLAEVNYEHRDEGWPNIDASLMFAHPLHGIYTLDNIGGLLRHNHYMAIGSGGPYALGAIRQGLPFYDPGVDLYRVLRIACELDPHSRAPVVKNYEELT